MVRSFRWIMVLALLVSAPGMYEATRAQFKAAPEGGYPPPTGQIAFSRDRDLWLMEADGSNPREIVTSSRLANKIVWSPDNQEILFCQDGYQQYVLPNGGGGKIKLYDIFATRVASPKSIKQVTTDAISASPSYFPDGDRIAFTRNLSALDLSKEVPLFQVYVGGTYGSPLPKNVNLGSATPDLQLLTPAVSPDGKQIAVAVTRADLMASPKPTLGIAIIPAKGFKGTMEEWTDKAAQIPVSSGPAWSPDGRYLAYVDISENPRSLALYDFERELNRVIYEPLKGFDLISASPSWSPDGNWIVFGNVKGSILMVDRNGRNLKSLTRSGSDSYPMFSNPVHE